MSTLANDAARAPEAGDCVRLAGSGKPDVTEAYRHEESFTEA